MNAPATAIDHNSGPVLSSRWVEASGAFLTALLINGLILSLLLFITVVERKLTSPTIYVTSNIKPEKPFTKPVIIECLPPSIQSGGAPLSPTLTITATATSELSMSIPDLPSIDDGVSGLAGLGNGFGSGLGSGFGAGDGTGSMEVGGMTVKAMKLGVILDVSGSMTEKLPAVKRGVRQAFRLAKTVDVEGCRLDWNAPGEAEDRRVRLRSTADSVIEAVEMLVVEGRVDALYWFSDLQDGENEAGLARLRELLRVEQGRAKAVRFYIRTLGKEPSPELAAIVRATGGAIQAGEKKSEAEK